MNRLWTFKEAIVGGTQLYMQFSQNTIHLKWLVLQEQCQFLHSLEGCGRLFPSWPDICHNRDMFSGDLFDILLVGSVTDEEASNAVLFKILHYCLTRQLAHETFCITSALLN